MVDQAQIDAWKAQYKNVFLVESQDEDYVFRGLSLGEFSAVQNLAQESNIEAEEAIVRFALLHPVLGDDVPAGIWTSLASEIIDVSYFNSPKAMKLELDAKRKSGESLITQIKAFIMASIPTCSEKELDDLGFEALAEKIVLAEQILKIQQASIGVEGAEITLAIVDPEEEAARAKKEAAKRTASKAPGEAGANDPIAAKLWAAMGKG